MKQMPSDPTAERLYNQAMDLKAKHIRAKEIKDNQEIEEAYMLANMPIHKKLMAQQNNPNATGNVEIRSLDEFMEDQIRFEQRKYEKLKNAILLEEAQEQELFQP